MKRPSHAGLRHVALNVIDLDCMERFYIDILGFKLEWRPDADNVYLCSGVDSLALHRVQDASRADLQALDHIGIIINDIGDVTLWYDYMKEHGVTLHNKAKTHRDGARSYYCADPEGNNIQIIFHPPISGKKVL
ncbi:MAG: VOC family protein [Arenicellaceae bacterium]|nr:VOC family protein [Arenicellaceae bacterium]